MNKRAKVRFSRIVAHPNRSFKLMPYDPKWPSQFENKAKLIRQILRPEMLVIEHIGSTAVPGMTAKSQIDILVVVKDLSKIKAYYPAMERAGFTPRGNYTGEGVEYFTEDTKDGERTVSVHVFPVGHVMVGDFLNVRDYLRAHPEEMTRYSDTKQRAVELNPNDYDAYYKTKLKVIQDVRQRAADWALNHRRGKR